jgi:pimeloyl-ACP methyl ester carboxylesterase
MNKNIFLKTVDRFKIAATHTISEGKGVVLWLHGITVNKDEYQNFFKDGAEYLARFGIDSLRIDFRGHGKSSGSSMDFSVTGQMLDVQAAIAYLKNYYKKINSLVIVGCSFGAPPSLFAVEQYSKIVRSLVLIAPVLSYQRTFLKPETDWAKSIFNPLKLRKLEKTNKLFINPDFPISSHLIEEMKIIRPEITLQKIRKRISIIHGDADSMVPFQASKDLCKGTKSIKFIPFRGMEHGYADEKDEDGVGYQSIANKLRIYNVIRDQSL